MRNYIILNGKNSKDIQGLLIQELAPISKPLLRTQIEEIDGRDGDIVTKLGYSAYDKQITIGLYGNFDINEVIAFFNSEGIVVFSNEPNKYYHFQIINQIDFDRLVRFRTATVAMHCQPFKYSTSEGAEILSPTDNLITIPDWSKTSNGITLTSTNGVISVNGKGTAATEFYVPITAMTLTAGSYTLSAYASGDGATAASIRVIQSVPSDAQSFGGGYIGLQNNATVTKSATLTTSTTYNYLWFYIVANKAMNFTLTTEILNDANKTVSDEGSNLVLENTAEAPFNKLEPKGNATQETIPGINQIPLSEVDIDDSHRVVSYSGANITAGTHTISFDLVSFELGTNTSVGLTFRVGSTQDVNIIYFNSSTTLGRKTYTYSINDASTSGEFRIALTMYNAGGRVKISNIQLEEGSVAHDYTPFVGGIDSPNPDYPQDVNVVSGAQTVKITGKNLLNPDKATATSHGMTLTNNGDGSFGVSGTTDAITTIGFSATYSTRLIAGQTYAISANNPIASAGQNIQVRLHKNGGGVYGTLFLNTVNSTGTYTPTENMDAYLEICVSSGYQIPSGFTVKPQIELGNQASAYEAYKEQSYVIPFGDTYLAKIGDYADEPVNVDGTWYIRRAIHKVVLDGYTETTWSIANTGTANYYYRLRYLSDTHYVADGSQWKSDRLSPAAVGQTTTEQGCFIVQSGELRIRYGAEMSLADWKTWLASNNITLYYQAETPTDVEITDQDLIDALDELYDQAHSYKGRTHINAIATGDNAPHIIAAEVIKSNDGTVTNSGNIYSKPKLTIYGSGNIGIYLNDYQMFEIALGDEGYITIDTNLMEAYKDSLDNLKNRLVTGDYNNFKLNPGENDITFSGTVTKCIIENYSRWL